MYVNVCVCVCMCSYVHTNLKRYLGSVVEWIKRQFTNLNKIDCIFKMQSIAQTNLGYVRNRTVFLLNKISFNFEPPFHQLVEILQVDTVHSGFLINILIPSWEQDFINVTLCRMLWMELCPPKFICEALTPSVIVFENQAFERYLGQMGS